MDDNLSTAIGRSYLVSPTGLTAQVNANGSIRRVEHGSRVEG
jgi:hypothetical protein